MVEKLQIRNCGSNKKLDIEFGERVTTIIGKSFIGKSWTLRAMRLVARNKPSGTSYINWDADKASVRLIVDGNKITRTRSSSVNIYKLNNNKPYEAFRGEVPEDIANILNLSDINFHGVNTLGQHEPPFWFCETAGEVSRKLNSIVNLEVIDSTLSNIKTKLNKAKLTIEVIEGDLETASEEKKNLDYIDELDENLVEVENLQKTTNEKAIEYTTLNELLQLVSKYREKKDNRLGYVLCGKQVLSKGDLYRSVANQVKSISELVNSAEQLRKDIDAKPPSLKPLENLKVIAKNKTIEYELLIDLVETLENHRERKCQAQKNLNELKKELVKAMSGRCPLCGKKQ